jgi:hypothetical protein
VKNEVSKHCDACGATTGLARERHGGFVLMLCTAWRECIERFNK